MSRSAAEVTTTSANLGRSAPTSSPPRRTAPFDLEPGFYEPAALWLFGNARLLMGKLAFVDLSFGPANHAPSDLDEVERIAEGLVLSANVLVSGIHSPAHMRAAIVPLRWGAPRILVVSGGIEYHLGSKLDQEPFRAARLWRYQWDPRTDLIVSRRAPRKLPTFARTNPTVDRLIRRIVKREVDGLLFGRPEFTL